MIAALSPMTIRNLARYAQTAYNLLGLKDCGHEDAQRGSE
jgi:hypothetical protein